MVSNSGEKRERRDAKEAKKNCIRCRRTRDAHAGHNETQKSQTKISFNAMDFVNDSTDKQRAREPQRNDKKLS